MSCVAKAMGIVLGRLASIMERGVLSTPALVKGGRVLFAGKVLSVHEIASLLGSPT